MVAAKPDCTGQRFGKLTVLGKGIEPSTRRQVEGFRIATFGDYGVIVVMKSS